jgi:hypothetical protein
MAGFTKNTKVICAAGNDLSPPCEPLGVLGELAFGRAFGGEIFQGPSCCVTMFLLCSRHAYAATFIQSAFEPLRPAGLVPLNALDLP